MFKVLKSWTVIGIALFTGTLYAQTPAPAAESVSADAAPQKKLKVISNSGTAGTIGKFAADGNTMVNSLIMDTGTQVGINATPAPGCFFDVGGITRGEARFESRQGGSTTPGSGSGFWIGTPAGDYAGFQLSPTMDMDFWMVPATGGYFFRTMTILNNGNIGVNTNAPARKFHVNGLVRADDWFESRRGGSDTIDNGSGFHLGNSVGNYSALQLSANNNLDFWTFPNGGGNGWFRSMTVANDGKIGIGTAAPAVPLHIFNNTLGPVIRASFNGGGGDVYYMDIGRAWLDTHNNDFDIQMNGASKIKVLQTGNVGIGFTTPGTRLDVAGTALVYGGARRVMRAIDDSAMAAGVGAGIDFLGKFDTAGNYTQYANLKGVKVNNVSGDLSGKLVASIDNSLGSMIEIATVDMSGLAVSGNISATGSITGATVLGAVFQDVAEWVPATEKMNPGTVVVLNREHDNLVMPSTHAYDTAVAGVVSAQPGLLLGVGSDSKAQVATTGRVKVHVDATQGAISIGDLLVTGDKPGTAMKSQPIDLGGVAIHRPGTVIGKALQPLPNGEGDILVLLSLQ